ncbi:septum site-determining protein MinC [Verticiella sediminum]|uniref:Probable septum site-determining protein MinC n=1 Tax=Verticiella sediminum TaxID=1247510 RepID=A0A556A913_9BURK|nr:septum site-determining protein MinC [Verticiella sediminum]TSH89376.1 septum site-determining protein MinC [Verticiella sediminum]
MSPATQPVLDFKSATLYAVRLVLRSADTATLLRALNERLDAAPGFFEGEPVVIDATRLEQAPAWRELADTLQRRGLPVVGVAAADAWQPEIQAAGLAAVHLPAGRDAAPLASGSVHRDPPAAVPEQGELDIPAPAEVVAQAGVAHATADAVSAAPQPPAETGRPTLMIDRSLRSGQRVYARGADLVVIGMVSPGAEVIADGSIHVYGPLRGKAMAGARGDESARIFTTRLDAELVAVAGIYRVVDTRLPENVQERPATVRLQAGALSIEPLAI